MIPFVRILGYGNVIERTKIISAPGNFNSTFVLLNNGDMYGSGSNSGFAFGTGNTVPIYGNIQLLKSDVKYCNMGSASVYITNDNKIWWCGAMHTFNSAGTNQTSWLEVTSQFGNIDIPNIKHIIPGYTSFVLMNNGELYGRGLNRSGTIGLGNSSYVNTWTLMGTGVKEIYGEAGGDTLIQIRMDGTIWGTGNNNSRQLGVASGNQMLPVQMFSTITFDLNAFWFDGSSCVLISTDNKLHFTGSTFVNAPDFYKSYDVPFNVGDCSKLYHPLHSGNVCGSRVFLYNLDTSTLMGSGYKQVNALSTDILPMGTTFSAVPNFPYNTDIMLGGLHYENVWFSYTDVWINGYPPSTTGDNNYGFTSVPPNENITLQNGLPF